MINDRISIESACGAFAIAITTIIRIATTTFLGSELWFWAGVSGTFTCFVFCSYFMIRFYIMTRDPAKQIAVMEKHYKDKFHNLVKNHLNNTHIIDFVLSHFNGNKLFYGNVTFDIIVADPLNHNPRWIFQLKRTMPLCAICERPLKYAQLNKDVLQLTCGLCSKTIKASGTIHNLYSDAEDSLRKRIDDIIRKNPKLFRK